MGNAESFCPNLPAVEPTTDHPSESAAFCPNLPAVEPIIDHPSESAASNQFTASGNSQLIGKGHEHSSRPQRDESSSAGSRVVGTKKLDSCCNLSNPANKRKRTIIVMDVRAEPDRGRSSTASTEDTACSRPMDAVCPQCRRICGFSEPSWLAITCDRCNLSAFRQNLDSEFDVILHHASGGDDHSRSRKRPRILLC